MPLFRPPMRSRITDATGPFAGTMASTPSGTKSNGSGSLFLLPGRAPPSSPCSRMDFPTLAPNPAIPRITFTFRPFLVMVSPGASSVPDSMDPNMTVLAPAAIALVMSPLFRMPPSAIMGTPWRSASSTHSSKAVSCGTPHPVTSRVIQIDPGPTPTLIASAPASTSALTPSSVATLPATISMSGMASLMVLVASMPSVECP
mmetsp:Transcript_49098/g.147836  ORF Transcript_49098/g.147836 Transcript_49098/m.147836 type:complete len:202 (+) Transcript_49098:384-989(+)